MRHNHRTRRRGGSACGFAEARRIRGSVHARRPRIDGSLPDAASFDARYGDFYDGYTYGLFGTPTSKALEDLLNALSGASRTLLAPSGQAALSLVFTTFLKPGDHVLIPDSVYGPVRGFATSWLAHWGVEITFYDPCIAAASRT